MSAETEYIAITAAQIVDSSTVGRAVLTAPNETAALTAIAGAAPTGTGGVVRQTLPTLIGVNIPDLELVRFLNTGLATAASMYYWTAHDVNGGELIIDAVNRMALIPQGALQIGALQLNQSYVYLQSNGAATALDPIRETHPLIWRAQTWSGAVSLDMMWGSQLVPADTTGTNGKLVFKANVDTTTPVTAAGILNGGTEVFSINQAGATALALTVTNTIELPAGSAGTPAINFGNNAADTNTGIFSSAANVIDFSTNGTMKWQITSSGTFTSAWANLINAATFSGSSGSVSAPTFTFGSSSDTNTGMYRVGEGSIGFTCDGVLAAGIVAAGPYLVPVTGTTARIGGVLTTDTTQTGNVDAGEDTLQTYPVPAGLLGADGESFDFVFSGTTANNANVKTLKVKFGSTTILSVNLGASVAGEWVVKGSVIRTGATTQKCYASIVANAALASGNSAEYSTAGETLSGSVTFLLTGEATTTNDIVKEIFKSYFMP